MHTPVSLLPASPVPDSCTCGCKTWFPFTMRKVCLNGRDWLARDLTKAGKSALSSTRQLHPLGSRPRGSGTSAVRRPTRKVSWTTVLRDLARQVHPRTGRRFSPTAPAHVRDYYWTAAESEWASDILFPRPDRCSACCADVWPLTACGVHGPADVMRFLNRKACADGLPRASFTGEIHSDARLFEEWPANQAPTECQFRQNVQ